MKRYNPKRLEGMPELHLSQSAQVTTTGTPVIQATRVLSSFFPPQAPNAPVKAICAEPVRFTTLPPRSLVDEFDESVELPPPKKFERSFKERKPVLLVQEYAEPMETNDAPQKYNAITATTRTTYKTNKMMDRGLAQASALRTATDDKNKKRKATSAPSTPESTSEPKTNNTHPSPLAGFRDFGITTPPFNSLLRRCAPSGL